MQWGSFLAYFFDFWKFPNYPISQLPNYLKKKLSEKKLFSLLSPASWLNPEPSTMIRTLDILKTRKVAISGWKTLESLRNRYPRLVELKKVGDAFERKSVDTSNF